MNAQEQKYIEEFTKRNLIYNQTALIEDLLSNGYLDIGDIENIYSEENEDEFKEIFEWWLVDSILLDLLAEKNEPILRTSLGDWWGRTTTGQAVYNDSVIEEIAKEQGVI